MWEQRPPPALWRLTHLHPEERLRFLRRELSIGGFAVGGCRLSLTGGCGRAKWVSCPGGLREAGPSPRGGALCPAGSSASPLPVHTFGPAATSQRAIRTDSEGGACLEDGHWPPCLAKLYNCPHVAQGLAPSPRHTGDIGPRVCPAEWTMPRAL